MPAGSTNIPVASMSGFAVGQKMAIGYGATYPDVARSVERYELVTVTAVGKPGTQAYLAADAAAGATNIKVTSVADISVGDKIRLDINSRGHGIDNVRVTRIGTQASRTNLAADASAGATNIKVRNVSGFSVSDKITIGTPANKEEVTVAAIGAAGPTGTGIDLTPALTQAHIRDETVIAPGTGLDLAAPLKFNHAANLPFSDRGTGITFQPASAFSHSSNEPVQALGTGITLDSPLAKEHAINSVVRDSSVTTAGYQGTPAPNQWFGGPEFTANSPLFGRTITLRDGSIVLRDAAGSVVDSLNYGGLVEPWAAEGYEATSGADQSGCYVPAPGPASGFGPAAAAATNQSAGRFPDGADTDSNCTDFLTQAATSLSSASDSGATNIKVATVRDFNVGQKITIDTGANVEAAVIAKVGTAGATTMGASTDAGVTVIPVASVSGFRDGQTITIDGGTNSETAVVASIRRFGATSITVTTPLTHAHAADTQVSGTGIDLATGLTRAHAIGAQIYDDVPTPGAPNHYLNRPH
jgi:non-reducing end alpha-L-arabinofuranosidase